MSAQPADAAEPVVSVVVPTKDAARTLDRCLRSIRHQSWPALELIVVDNHSTDGTSDIARRWADAVLEAGPERSAQRNLGIARATGDWILWIDADMELPATLLANAMGAALAHGADGVFVPEVTVGDGYWTRCRALERSCATEEILVQSPRLVRRAYLVASGGFLESLSGTEDAELRSRMLADGCRLHWIPDLIIHDEGRMRLGGILRKRYYYGRGLAIYRAAHPGELGHQAGAAVSAYRRHWRRLTAQPHVAAGVVVMRAGELAAYGLGALAGARAAAGGARPGP